MRPSSKHGLEKKFKPWRKGKASSDKASGNDSGKASGNGSLKRPTNASLKNRLRGQKRLLAKLQQNSNNDGDDVKNKETIDGVQQSMKQLERDIAAYETRELEKKNATKYHQVKFIERQKLSRLEKSVKRQLQNLQQSDKEENEQQTAKQISNFELELQSIAMNQLYIAFYPTDLKYMALFTNGNNRVVDDERGQKRRMAAWNKIREGLLQELKQNDVSDSDNKDDKDNNGRTKMQLNNAKTWVNLDAAKKALLSMPADTYPDAPSADNAAVATTLSSASVKNKPKNKAAKKESASAAAATEKKGKAAATASDSRFANSKDLEGLFGESTTGDDYQKALKSKESSDESDSDDSEADSSSEDNADPLKALRGSKKLHTSSVSNAKQDDGSSSSSSSSAPSSSSSEDSSESDSDSSDSDSDVESPLKDNQQESHKDQEEEDADDGDDFFTTDKVSTEDIFTQVAKNNQKKKNSNHFDDELPSQKPKGDKSRGFKSQNQSKKEYSDFQHRQKRQKFI